MSLYIMSGFENPEPNQNQTVPVEKEKFPPVEEENQDNNIDNKGEEKLSKGEIEELKNKTTAENKEKEAGYLNEEILLLIEYIKKLEKEKSGKKGTDKNYLTALIDIVEKQITSLMLAYEENTGEGWTPLELESKPLDGQGHIESETKKLNENIKFGNED